MPVSYTHLDVYKRQVPENHFLRKVDRAVDFSFIYDLCAPLYCADNGRPVSYTHLDAAGEVRFGRVLHRTRMDLFHA